MLTVKNWCLPGDLSEEQLNGLHNSIVEAVVSIPEVGVQDESDMLYLSPGDPMTYGLGNGIVIEVTGFPIREAHNIRLRDKLADAIGTAVKGRITDVTVQCTVYTPDVLAGRWFQLSESKQFEQECEEGLHK